MPRNKKLTDEQIGKICHAMDNVIDVMHELEEAGKCKRIVNNLDKVCGILYNILHAR